MTYKETIDWMFAQLPMYQNRGAKAFKGKLDNSIAFAEHLNNPHEHFKSIHVAGTNGKGSSSHMLASIFQEAGYKTGLYTSPHLKDFRERIKIDGKKVGKKFVVDFISHNNHFIESLKPSFFEMTVAMAFQHFANEKVDMAIIEVGLGGQLDSTNIITPQACLITNIGYDHMSFLGNTLEKIAMEKAGIIKRNIPVAISERQPETEMIFKLLANQKGAPIVFSDELEIPNYKTDLLGDYQQKNIKGVLACLGVLKQNDINSDHIENGLAKVVQNTGLLGRWQILGQAPKVICDTAHNEEGLQLVLRQLQNEAFDQLHIVLGFVNDKEVKKLLDLFPVEAKYYFVRPNVPRGMDETELKNLSELAGLKGKAYPSVQKGLKKAMKNATRKDLVFAGGSTFVVAEVI